MDRHLGPIIALALILAVAVPHATAAHADAAGGGGDFVPLSGPAAVLDTRTGIGAAAGVRGAASTTTFPVLGVGGVPTSGVGSLLVRLGVLDPTADTWLELWPDGTARPTVTMLSAGAGEDLSNSAVVKVGDNGRVSVYNNAGKANILVEVQGYFKSAQGTTGGGFVPVTHTRLIDTRNGLGTTTGKIAAGATRTLQITGSVIPAGSAAALVNMATPGATADGWLAVGPTGGTARPLLNYVVGNTQSGAELTLPASGQVTITNKGSAAVDVMVNVEGYYSASATQGAGLRLVSSRLINTRTVAAGLPVPANGVIDVQVGGTNGLPTRGIAGAALNVVVTPEDAGFLRVWPLGEAEPNLTVMDFKAGIWRANSLVVKPGTDGRIRIRNGSSGTAHVIVDLQGWYANPLPAVPVAQNTPTTALAAAAVGGAAAGANEYAYVDNGGNVRWGHQSDPDNFASLQWTVVSGGERFSGPPAVSQLADGRIQISAQFRDGNIWSITQTTAGQAGWGPWVNIGGSMASGPVAGKLANGTIVQFAVDADGKLWSYAQTGPVPYWQNLGDQNLTATVSLVRVNDGVRVFALTDQGAVRTIEYYDDRSVSSWTDLGGAALAGAPAVIARPGFQLQVFAWSPAGTIVSKLQDIGGAWPADWQTVGTVNPDVAGAPAAVMVPDTSRAMVVVRGADNQLYQVSETATGSNAWGSWRKTVEGDDPASTDPAILSYQAGNGPSVVIVGRDINGAPRFYTQQ